MCKTKSRYLPKFSPKGISPCAVVVAEGMVPNGLEAADPINPGITCDNMLGVRFGNPNDAARAWNC